MSVTQEASIDITTEPLQVAFAADCITFTLNRPHRHNALDTVLVEALHEALDDIDHGNIRMLVLQGAGPSFCSGFDLSNLAAETDGSLLLRFVRIEQLLQRIFRAPFQTVALAHGRTFGAGADLFCACEHRFAAPDTTLRFPGTSFGLALGSGRLAARLGIDAALSLLRATDSVDADRAKVLGLAGEIVPTEQRATRLERLKAETSWIEPETLSLVLERALPASDQDDLANLVRSAARPGLKRRIMHYAARRDRQR
jgi:enoyl-CoA hydratase/carnithine racemase